MAPKFDKLIEFADLLHELIKDTTDIEPEEIEIKFKAPKVFVNKINEDFWYRLGNEKNGKPTETDNVDIELNGMHFIYESIIDDNKDIENETETSKTAGKNNKRSILDWFRRK